MTDARLSDEGRAGPRNRWPLIALACALIVAALAAQWWHTSRSQRFGEAMAAMARPGDIHMIASRDCEGCDIARAWLRQYRVMFTECNMDKETSCQEAFRASGAEKTPAIMVRGELQQGFWPQRIFDRLRTRA